MDDRHSIYRDQFNFFVNGFVAMVSISLAVYAIYISGGIEAMIQPLPSAVLTGIIIAFIFALVALISGIRVLTTPKDTRLGDILKGVNELKQGNNKPNIIINANISTNDIAKLNKDQLKVIIEIVDKLQNKSS